MGNAQLATNNLSNEIHANDSEVDFIGTDQLTCYFARSFFFTERLYICRFKELMRSMNRVPFK